MDWKAILHTKSIIQVHVCIKHLKLNPRQILLMGEKKYVK